MKHRHAGVHGTPAPAAAGAHLRFAQRHQQVSHPSGKRAQPYANDRVLGLEPLVQPELFLEVMTRCGPLPANRQAWQAIAGEPTSQRLEDIAGVLQVAEVQGVR